MLLYIITMDSRQVMLAVCLMQATDETVVKSQYIAVCLTTTTFADSALFLAICLHTFSPPAQYNPDAWFGLTLQKSLYKYGFLIFQFSTLNTACTLHLLSSTREHNNLTNGRCCEIYLKSLLPHSSPLTFTPGLFPSDALFSDPITGIHST